MRGFIRNRNEGEVVYRNIFEGFDKDKSKHARSKWIVKEEKRMDDRRRRNRKIDDKKRKKVPKKRRQNSGVNKVQEKRQKICKTSHVVPSVPEGKEAMDSYDIPVEEKQPLRGGALLFQMRKDRTLLYQQGLDN